MPKILVFRLPELISSFMLHFLDIIKWEIVYEEVEATHFKHIPV